MVEEKAATQAPAIEPKSCNQRLGSRGCLAGRTSGRLIGGVRASEPFSLRVPDGGCPVLEGPIRSTFR
jgi:hypothetical protein